MLIPVTSPHNSSTRARGVIREQDRLVADPQVGLAVIDFLRLHAPENQRLSSISSIRSQNSERNPRAFCMPRRIASASLLNEFSRDSSINSPCSSSSSAWSSKKT